MTNNIERYLDFLPMFDIEENGDIYTKERVYEWRGNLKKSPRHKLPFYKAKSGSPRRMLRFAIWFGGKMYYFYPAYFVALKYKGTPAPNQYLFYRDGNMENINASNLEWAGVVSHRLANGRHRDNTI